MEHITSLSGEIKQVLSCGSYSIPSATKHVPASEKELLVHLLALIRKELLHKKHQVSTYPGLMHWVPSDPPINKVKWAKQRS